MFNGETYSRAIACCGCYRQVLPTTTGTVQKPSLLKASQARIQSNGFKRIITNQNPSFNQLTPKSCHEKRDQESYNAHD